MKRLGFTWLAGIACLATGLVAFPVSASKAGGNIPGSFVLNDTADVFSAAAEDKANSTLREAHFDRPVHLIVETFAKVPDDRKAAFDAATDKRKFYRDWAKEVYHANKDRGIYVQIVMTGHIEVVVDDQIAERRHFSNDDSNALAKTFSDAFQRAKGKPAAEAQSERDRGLTEASAFVVAQLQGTKIGGETTQHAG